MKTFSAKPGGVERVWFVADLDGKVLGRAASRVATILRGKHKPEFTPHVDTGDFVIAVNAKKIVLTGRKLEQKKYYRHSGYPGGLKEITAAKLLEINPEEVFRLAVKRMLPKSQLGQGLITKLKIYGGPEHPHGAQQPKALEL
jgi:large subunit ribosomal protein L13